MEICRSSSSMFISSLGAESRHTVATHLLEALSHCSKNIFWVTANRVLPTDFFALHHCRRSRPRPASPKARSCKYKNEKCRLWSTFESFLKIDRFVTGKTERKIINFSRKRMKKTVNNGFGPMCPSQNGDRFRSNKITKKTKSFVFSRNRLGL